MKRPALLLVVILASTCVGQNYRCDWWVVGKGGARMNSTSYACQATVAQTAIGRLTGADLLAFVGFWVPGLCNTGVVEQSQPPSSSRLVTELRAPRPNPFQTRLAIRYSLAAEGLVSLVVHDLTGRTVRTLCASSLKRGAYSVTWDGRDSRHQLLPNGVYFLKFRAGEYRQTEKLVLQR